MRKNRHDEIVAMFQTSRAATLLYPGICAGISNDILHRDKHGPTNSGLNGYNPNDER